MVQKKKDQIREEADRYLREQVVKGDILYEKWSGNEIGCGNPGIEKNVDIRDIYEKNPNKARLIARGLENQEKHLESLNETVIQSTFSTTPENLLKIVKRGVANSNRSEMFTEVSLDTTDDALYFVDMTHEATLTGKDATAADKIFENAYAHTVGEENYKDTAGDGTDTYAITCDYTPVKVNKVFILLDNKLVGYDDGAGAITVVGTDLTSGTVTYASGAIALVFAAVVATTSNIRVLYHYDSEDSTNYTQYPKVSLAISKQRFKARPMSLGYTYSQMAELVLGTQMKEDVETLLVNAVSAEHARARDFRAIAFARNVAKTNQAYEFNCQFADEGEMAYISHAQRIYNVIDTIGGKIHDDKLRGRPTTIIAGNDATSYMRNHKDWKEDMSQPREGVYKAGTLNDLTVFTCPAATNILATNEMLLTYKNPLEGLDVSIAFGVLTELTAALAYPQFYVDGNIAVVEDKMLITREFIRLLTLNNLDNYAA